MGLVVSFVVLPFLDELMVVPACDQKRVEVDQEQLDAAAQGKPC